MFWTHYVVLGIGIMLGVLLGAIVACVLSVREYTRQEAAIESLEQENMNLRTDLKFLKMDLESVQYRHARVQDFCVKVCDQLDEARGISYAE